MDPITLFKALADETRLRCVILMFHQKELCVCELMVGLEESQPKISRHLAMLRKSELVQDRREGQWIYYQLHPELPTWARTIILEAAKGAVPLELFKNDQHRVDTMTDRPTRCSSS